MYPTSDSSVERRLAQLLIALCVAVLLWGTYQIYSAIKITQTTGILAINTPNDSAKVSISQENHEAQIIGKGDVRVRIKSGVYIVSASSDGSQQTKVVRIQKQKTTTATLDFNNQPSTLQSPDNIDFQNESELLDSGLSTSQVTELEQYLFSFNKSAKRVEIISGSVQPGPRDPNGTIFIMNFSLDIDGKSYSATATYSDTNNIQLVLLDSEHNPVFNSNSLPIGGAE